MDSICIQAEYVLASDGSLLHPGQIVVKQGRIVSVTANIAVRPDLDLERCVLLPALINAHTHLEFSDLVEPFAAGAHFPGWISKVISHRRHAEMQFDENENEEHRRQAIKKGLTESFMSGTQVLADIVSYPWQPDDLPTWESLRGETCLRQPTDQLPVFRLNPDVWRQHVLIGSFPKVVALAEVIGLMPERCQLTSAWAGQLLSQGNTADELLSSLGVSPHAPYSVLLPLARQLIESLPPETMIAMHLAESREELELLEHATGPFRESLEAAGIPVPSEFPTLEECIALLASRRRALLVHGNYLSSSQIELAAKANTISCVYCPRTHEHFGHEPYPLEHMQMLGLPIVLGTDSRASTPDLNLWAEVVAARSQHDNLTPRAAFEAVTLGPARALGMDATLGSVEEGKLAALNVVPCQEHWTVQNLLEEMTTSRLECIPLELFFAQ